MFFDRALVGGLIVAVSAASLAVAPAFGASEVDRQIKRAAPIRSNGGFTPSAADPRLAAAFARSGLASSDFRFTPSETRQGNRAVTVAVRARTNRTAEDAGRLASVAGPMVGLMPVAYNLGVSVGWKRFAVTGDVARVDLAGQPGSREVADVGVSYSLPRFTGRVNAAADRALPGAPKVAEDAPSYSLDVGGSYSLTRNVDLTAGVRYKSERERLARLSDDRRDSQAVYVGTAFRF
ncbi:porin [Sphingomonas radiodurans]|uniref:porin n=1 Tax=Sphingomonas radiodurans TaxID=2890321 RepID=UPI001E5A0BB0|nr:porin [Sphingomonas radiodurans]WBH18113.1 porin [Sphingomonas radiodurans]